MPRVEEVAYMVPTSRKSAPSDSAILAPCSECTDRPISAPDPRIYGFLRR